MRYLKVLTAAALMLAAGQVAAGSVPPLINYQGRLMDSGGMPVSVSTAMSFSLWDGQTAGTMLWSESKPVDVNVGLYSVILGDSVAIPSTALSGATVYLQVTVLGEALSPREQLTSVPYAMESDRLDGLDATSFSLAGHTHNFSEITGTATDAQIPDNITIVYSQNSGQLGGQPPNSYVSASGDTVSGDLELGQDLIVHGDASILGGNIGLGVLPLPAYGLINSSVAPFNYGASLYGASVGVRGEAPLGTNTYGILGQPGAGVTGSAGTSASATSQYGGNFSSSSTAYAYGISGQSYSYGASGNAIGAEGYASSTGAGYAMGGEFSTDPTGTGNHYGVYVSGLGNSSSPVYTSYNYASNSTGAAYAGYFYTDPTGTGPRYGIVVNSVGNSGLFESGELHVGTGGAENHIGGGDGELYVKNMTEIDGGAYVQGDPYGVYAEWSGDPSYNYAYLGSQNTAVTGYAGKSTDTANKYGGSFQAQTGGYAYGITGVAYGYSTPTTYGSYGYAGNYGAGQAYGGYFAGGGGGTGDHTGMYASASASGTATGTGVYGTANNPASGTLYGGRFTTASSGTGAHYGVYGSSDDYSLYGQNSLNPDTHGYIASTNTAVYGTSGTSSSTNNKIGGYFIAATQGSPFALDAESYGYAGYSTYSLYSYATNYSSGSSFGAYIYASSTSGTAYGLYVAGGIKSWVNPDPEDPTKSIVYATLEGGENGTYWRGMAKLDKGSAVVVLPDHFRKVTSPDYPVTVTVSPLGECNGLYVVSRSNERIEVKELNHGTSDVDFDFIVMGKRLGYEDFQPIIDNVDYVPFQGNQAGLDDSQITTQQWYDSQPPGLRRIFEKNGTLDKDGKVNEALFKARGWKEVRQRDAH